VWEDPFSFCDVLYKVSNIALPRDAMGCRDEEIPNPIQQVR